MTKGTDCSELYKYVYSSGASIYVCVYNRTYKLENVNLDVMWCTIDNWSESVKKKNKAMHMCLDLLCSFLRELGVYKGLKELYFHYH